MFILEKLIKLHQYYSCTYLISSILTFFTTTKTYYILYIKIYILISLNSLCVQLNKDQPVTVHDTLRILRLHVSVPQCDVFGYLSIDHELVVLIAPVDQQPTPLQVTHTHVHTLYFWYSAFTNHLL